MAKKTVRVPEELADLLPPLPPQYKEYKAKVEIDREDLEQCLEEQSQLFSEVSELSTQWNAIRDARKAELEELASDLDQDIRRRYAEANQKTTESAIFNEVKSDPDYKTFNKEYLTAKYYADLWTGLLKSYEQRSHSLRALTSIAVKITSIDHDIISTSASRVALTDAKAAKQLAEAGKARRERIKSRK